MTPRELPKYEVLFFLFFYLVGRVRAFLAGRAHPMKKSFPKPLPVQLLKNRDKLSKMRLTSTNMQARKMLCAILPRISIVCLLYCCLYLFYIANIIDFYFLINCTLKGSINLIIKRLGCVSLIIFSLINAFLELLEGNAVNTMTSSGSSGPSSSWTDERNLKSFSNPEATSASPLFMSPEDTGSFGSNPRPVGPDPLEQQGNTVSGGNELLGAVRPFLLATGAGPSSFDPLAGGVNLSPLEEKLRYRVSLK